MSANGHVPHCRCPRCEADRIQDIDDRAIARAEEPDIDPDEEPPC